MYRIRIIASLGLLLFMSASQAQSPLTFNLTGTITPGVCSFTATDVDLGTYPATLFTGNYATPFRDVLISSQGCDPLVTMVHMTFSGTADAADPALFLGVTGIGIELQRKSPVQAIRPTGTTLDFVPVAAGGNHFLQARFKQSAPAVASGSVTRPIVINFTYN